MPKLTRGDDVVVGEKAASFVSQVEERPRDDVGQGEALETLADVRNNLDGMGWLDVAENLSQHVVVQVQKSSGIGVL